MANFSFVSNAQFRPFSYQEMLQPLKAYTDEYNTVQEGLGVLGAEASVYERMANEQSDPEAYGMYKKYADDLKEQASILASQGLNPASRQGLINMKNRYGSEIVPIQEAYKKRQALVEEQRKGRLSDSTMLYDRDASTISLDELINNPAATYQSYSGALVSKQVAQAAQNLSKEMRENPREWRSILGNQYYETMMQKGFKSEDILNAIQNNPNASPILTGIVEDALASTGIQNWNNPEMLNRALQYANEGLWSGVGTTEYQNVSNKAYDFAMQMALVKARKGNTNTGSPEVYRSVPKTTVDREKKTTQLNKDLTEIQEILNNPALLNKSSTRTIREVSPFMPDPMTGVVMDSGTGAVKKEETYYPYREKLANLSKKYGDINYELVDNTMTGGGLTLNSNLDQIATKIANDIRSSAVRDFVYAPNVTSSKLISQVIKENSRILSTSNGSTGLTDAETGKVIKVEDMNKYFSSDNNLSYDPEAGIILNSTDKDGNVKAAILDPELIDDSQRNVSNMMENIDILLKEGRTKEASLEINSFMTYIYAKFNTLAKVQGETDSKLGSGEWVSDIEEE